LKNVFEFSLFDKKKAKLNRETARKQTFSRNFPAHQNKKSIMERKPPEQVYRLSFPIEFRRNRMCFSKHTNFRFRV